MNKVTDSFLKGFFFFFFHILVNIVNQIDTDYILFNKILLEFSLIIVFEHYMLEMQL